MSSVDQSSQAATGDSAPYVQLFQKAHQKIVMLERLDEQAVQIQAKRQELQEELRSIQAQLNEEFETRITPGEGAAPPPPPSGRPMVTINAEAAAKRNGPGARFAGQTIDSMAQERAVG
jgi:hypothetical protein